MMVLTYSQIYYLSLTLLGLTLCVLTYIFSYRITRSIKLARDRKNFKEFEAALQIYIHGSGIIPSIDRHKNRAARACLVKWAESFKGDERQNIIELYDYLGYLRDDIKKLKYAKGLELAEAICRCRSLGIDLPSEAFRHLLKNKDPMFRWAILEYIIAVKKQKALVWFCSYVINEPNMQNGILQHLLSCMAKYHSDINVQILKYSDDPQLIEQALRSLAIYPSAEAEKFILPYLHDDTPDETYIAAIKALGNTPTENTIYVFELAKNHPHWVVRLQIAYFLVLFDELEAINILKDLIEDVNYSVRFTAIKSLASKSTKAAKEILNSIRANENHPCFNLLRHVDQWEAPKNAE